MKEFGPEEGVHPRRPPWIRQWSMLSWICPLREFYRINTFKHWEIEGGARDTRPSLRSDFTLASFELSATLIF